MTKTFMIWSPKGGGSKETRHRPVGSPHPHDNKGRKSKTSEIDLGGKMTNGTLCWDKGNPISVEPGLNF